ncbi:MAG: hypothetical protein WCG10_03175 [Chlamydiota bacterium]
MAYKESDTRIKERQAYSKLIETCLCSDSDEKIAQLGCLQLDTSYVLKDFRKQVDAFIGEIYKLPLAVFIAVWAGLNQAKAEELNMMSDLIVEKLLPLSSLEKLSQLDPSSIPDDIRCFDKWTLMKREEGVLLYTSFMSWLSKETFNYVPIAKDGDRIVAQYRQVPFETYVKILSRLDLREQILAKMFYLGGSRALEEVLSVKIEDIDFYKKRMHLLEDVSYPRHLFEDIKKHIQDRKKGYVFIGKEGEIISHTTSFRALKKVVSELHLDPEFTFKEFTKNI